MVADPQTEKGYVFEKQVVGAYKEAVPKSVVRYISCLDHILEVMRMPKIVARLASTDSCIEEQLLSWGIEPDEISTSNPDAILPVYKLTKGRIKVTTLEAKLGKRDHRQLLRSSVILDALLRVWNDDCGYKRLTGERRTKTVPKFIFDLPILTRNRIPIYSYVREIRDINGGGLESLRRNIVQCRTNVRYVKCVSIIGDLIPGLFDSNYVVSAKRMPGDVFLGRGCFYYSTDFFDGGTGMTFPTFENGINSRRPDVGWVKPSRLFSMLGRSL